MSGLSRLIRFAIPPAGAAASAAAGALLWPTRAATRADFGPPKAPGRESWVTSAGGARLRVVAYGPEDAPPIVFSHGWTCDAEVWLPQVHALAEQYRVVTYDQRGHGQSSIGDGVRIELLGDDLSAVLSASLRPGERAVVVGHSMGGITIMSWAQRHPQDVQEQANAVVLTGTGAHGIVDKIDVPFLGAGGQLSALFGRLIVFLLGLPVPMSLPLVKRAGVVRFIVRNIALCPEADDAAADLTAKMTLDCPVDGRAGGVRALTKDLDVREGVRNLVVPAFVVVGAQDRLMPATHGYEMADVLAETGWLERLVVYPGSGHMIGLEATEEYNALLREVAEQFSRTAVGADR